MGKKIAIYDQSTGKDYTYSQVLIASLIISKKIKRYHSKYIGIMLPPGAGSILSFMGILMKGKTPVMINYSTGAVENCKYAQKKCNFRTVITSKKLLDKLGIEAVNGMIFIEDILLTISTLDKLKAALLSKLPLSIIKTQLPSSDEDDTAVILFTSGSEKDPKAVQLTHKNISHNINGFTKIIDISERDIFIANLPYFHVMGLTVELWLPLLLGASIVAQPNPLDYKAIVDSIRKYQVSIMIGTPTFFYGYFKKAGPGDFKSVRIAIAGADKLNMQIRDEYLKHHDLEVLEGYGTTETSPVISTNTPLFNKFGSVGKPLPGVQVKIVSIETNEELPRTKEGKILIKGDLVMKGYFNDLEETSLRIHNGWYETGDMGYVDNDGFLWHTGRLKRFVKIGGEMISLAKVESILEKYLPEGTISCVVEIPNPIKGADIVAAVTTQEINKHQIIKKMGKDLPNIAIPKRFHVLESIPLMGSGKVNFRAVEEICRELEKEGD